MQLDHSFYALGRVRRAAIAAAAVAVSALMVRLGEGIDPIWPLAWLAPVPVLILAYRLRPVGAFSAAFIAWTAGRLSLVPYFRVLSFPSPAIALVVAAPAALIGLWVLVSRSLVLRGAPLSGVIAFAAGRVSFEYVLSFGPHGTWGSLAYSQMDFLPVIQLASVTGLWGVSFLVTLVAATIAVGLHRLRPVWVGGAALLVVIVVLLGQWRLRAAALAPLGSSASSVTIGQAATEESVEAVRQVISGDPAYAPTILDAYLTRVEALASQGAVVVVLPEEIVGAHEQDIAAVQERLAALAARDHVTVVAGVRLVAQSQGRNMAMVLSPAGALLGIYVKEHLVPGFESPLLAPGHDLLVVDGAVRYGIAICKDMDFRAPATAYARANVGLMLVPAWDFDLDGWLHARMAIMRGVEQGLPIARSAQRGQLTVSDAYGRVLSQTVTGNAPASQVSTIRVGRVPTAYSRMGDWFAFVCVTLLAAALARIVVLRAKQSGRGWVSP
jgi:apolipoprotein N-acyltransferase